MQAAKPASDVPTERSGSQKRTPTTSKDHTQSVVQRLDSSNTVLSQKKQTEQSNHGNKTSDLERSSLKANDTNTKCQTPDIPQLTKIRLLRRKSLKKPSKPKHKIAPTEKTSDFAGQKSTQAPPVEAEVKVIQSEPLSNEPTITQPSQSEQVKPKQAPVQSTTSTSTPATANRVPRDIFTVRVKSDPVKASPVKVQCKPRRQTRATLAYDRVMFFSDFFRRLESDRSLFALPPVRRNRVYVRPRAEDSSTAPVKFPRPSIIKKGRIAVVTAARSSDIRSSPFSSKRRFPSHGWDHKIDLASIEADAASTAQSNQCSSFKQPLVSPQLAQERPKQSLGRNIYQGEETAKADNAKVTHGISTGVNADSAFIAVVKHSAKLRRRLKRKQRKRSVTSSEGIENGVQDTSTSSSEEGKHSQRGNDGSRRGSKKEHRTSTEQHLPTISSTVTAVAPPKLRSHRKTQSDTDTKFDSHVNRAEREIKPKPIRSAISDGNNLAGISAPRGKTVVEILSRIGEQTHSDPNEASISPKPDETKNQGEEDCSVSIVVDVLDDIIGSENKLKTITSQLTASGTLDSAAKEDEKSTDSSGMKVSSMEHRIPSSPASAVTRLNVTKTLGDGLLLRRSHSCGEMRRRMVLTEWEVVTTTNTEVTVMETGPSSERTEKLTPSDSETTTCNLSLTNLNGELPSESQGRDGSAHDSRKQTLGLAKNIAGHHRSKSSDGRTRRHGDAATTVEIPAVSKQHGNDCLVSSVEPNREHRPQSDHRDDTEVDTAIIESPDLADDAVPSTDNKISKLPSIEEGKSGEDNSNLPVLESTRVASVQECPVTYQLDVLKESCSEPTSTQLEGPIICTYTLTNPSLFDRFRGVAETGREKMWGLGLDADHTVDYALLDIVENIRLRTVGSDQNDLDPEYVEDQPKTSDYQQNSVTEYLEVLSHDENDEGGIREEVEESIHVPHLFHCQRHHLFIFLFLACVDNEVTLTLIPREEVEESIDAPHLLQCQPTAHDSGVTDHQQDTCSSVIKHEDVRDSDGFVDNGQDILATPEASCPAGTTLNGPPLADRRKNLSGNVSEPRVKEDEDSEEKEADEAENNREAESEDTETEEKGMQELNYSVAGKNGGPFSDEPTKSLENVDQLNCADATGVRFEQAAMDDVTQECSEQSAMDRDARQIEVDHGSLMNDGEIGPDHVLSSNINVLKSTTLSSGASEHDGQRDLIPPYEDQSEICDHQLSESHTLDNGVGHSVSLLHLPNTETCLSELPAAPELNPSITTVAGTEVKSENNSSNDKRITSETLQQYCEKVEDEEQVMSLVKSAELVDNRAAEYRISDVEEMVRVNTVSMVIREELNDAETGPSTASDDHTQCVERLPSEDTFQTSATCTNDMEDSANKNACVSTETDTSHNENSESVDNPMRSPTFAHKGTLLHNHHYGVDGAGQSVCTRYTTSVKGHQLLRMKAHRTPNTHLKRWIRWKATAR